MIHLLQNIYFLMKLFKKYVKINSDSNEQSPEDKKWLIARTCKFRIN